MAAIAIRQSSRGTLARAAIAQSTGLMGALWIAAIVPSNQSPWLLLALQALIACLVAHGLGMARWWALLHLIFAPAVAAALALGFSPALSGGIFLLLLAVFGVRTMTDQVPLFLSSRRALHALLRVLPTEEFSLLDPGAGTGRALAAVRRHRPRARLEGVETAPLPWLLAAIIGRFGGYRVYFGDLWSCDLSRHDFVYAYLSPAAMPRLWQKARAEMRRGSVLISNAFAVPGQPADEIIRYGREAGAVLYLWHMK